MNDQLPSDERAIPRIVCAAVKLKQGLVICAPRHFDKTMRQVIDRVGLSIKDAEQGFVDQFGTFYNRWDAHNVARNADQHHRSGGTLPTGICQLFSEDLY